MSRFHHFNWTRRACYFGYVAQAITINFAPLLFLTFEDQFGLDLSQISLLIGVNFSIQLLTDMLSAKFLDHIHPRAATLAAHLCVAAGLVGLATLPFLLPSPLAGLLVSVVFCGIGGGLTEVLISPIIEACPFENKASSMSLLHSFYCWGQAGVILVSVAFFALFGIEHWRILSCLLAIEPLLGALLFTAVPLAPMGREAGGPSAREVISHRLFLPLLLMIAASGASEQVMSQWASSFAESSLGVSKTVGDLLGPCLFAVLMGSARVLYAKLSDKIDLLPVVAASGVLCILSYLLAALAPNPVVALLGCGLCGLSVGVLWPGTYSLAAARIPGAGVSMFALLAIGGDLGCLLGPTLAGKVADAAGGSIGASFIFSTVFPALLLVAALLVFLLTRKSRKKEMD